MTQYTYADLIHQLDNGRWIVAHYDEHTCEWRSFTAYGCVYAYSMTLEQLAALTPTPTYAHRSSARRAARRHYYKD